MLLVDPQNGTVIDANAAAVSFYGYPPERLHHMRIAEISIPASELHHVLQLIQPKTGQQFQFQHRLADGSLRDVETSVSWVQIGTRRALHTIVHDITARKQTQAQMAALLLRIIHCSRLAAMAFIFWMNRATWWK